MSWYKQTGSYRNTFRNSLKKPVVFENYSFRFALLSIFSNAKNHFWGKTVREGKHHYFIVNVYMAEWIDGPSTALIAKVS